MRANGLYRQLWEFQSETASRELEIADEHERALIALARALAVPAESLDNGLHDRLVLSGDEGSSTTAASDGRETAERLLAALLRLLDGGSEDGRRMLAGIADEPGAIEAIARAVAVAASTDARDPAPLDTGARS
jgi:hypothetical protein